MSDEEMLEMLREINPQLEFEEYYKGSFIYLSEVELEGEPLYLKLELYGGNQEFDYYKLEKLDDLLSQTETDYFLTLTDKSRNIVLHVSR